MNDSENFYSGGHYLQWPKVCKCRSDLVRSGGRPEIIIHTITLLCISVHLEESCIRKFILRGINAERLAFATSNVTDVMRNCETNTNLSRKPCKF